MQGRRSDDSKVHKGVSGDGMVVVFLFDLRKRVFGGCQRNPPLSLALPRIETNSAIVSFAQFEVLMSVIKDLKLDFSSIAWCPAKEHASVMAMATMKNVTPLESEFPKSLSLYDWNLENVEEGKKVAEALLPSGICSLNWSRTTIPEQANAQGLISLGMGDGTVEFWIPSFSAESGWTLEKVGV